MDPRVPLTMNLTILGFISLPSVGGSHYSPCLFRDELLSFSQVGKSIAASTGDQAPYVLGDLSGVDPHHLSCLILARKCDSGFVADDKVSWVASPR